MSFFENTHLRALNDPEHSIAQVNNKDTLRKAYDLLVKYGVYCLPVHDADTKEYLGLLSLATIVKVITGLFADRVGGIDGLKNTQADPALADEMTHAFNALFIKKEHIQYCEPSKPGVNLQQAINFFAKPGHDLNHVRLPIVNDEGKIVNIASPYMIVKFIEQNLESLDQKVVTRPVAKFPGVVSPHVKTVRADHSALYALALCTSLGYSALGIEDPENVGRKIISIVSLKDANAASKSFQKLFEPVEQYINEIRRADLIDRAPTMNVTTTETLGNCVKKFIAVKRHRMFVRDPASDELVGIITLADILKAFSTSAF